MSATVTDLAYGSLFSGVGRLDVAVEAVTGATPAWHSEIEPGPAKVLARHWSTIPNLGDITAIDWATVPPVDILCGGFPCQDISTAGLGAGIIEGTRSGLWYRYADAIRVLRPRLVFVENVAALLVRGLDIVAASLAELGYRFAWGCLRASDVGAPHGRNRLWLVAADADQQCGLGWPASGRDTVRPDQRHDADRRGGAAAADASGERGGRDGRGAPGTQGQAPDEHGHGARHPGGSGPVADGWTAAADAQIVGHHGAGPARAGRNGSSDGCDSAADADDIGCEGGKPGTLGDDSRSRSGPSAWGPYAAAIARWEHVTGRPAPHPTDARGRLNPALPEWMMGWPAGWVTDHLPRTAALKAIGNGVCDRQGAAAFGELLRRLETAS